MRLRSSHLVEIVTFLLIFECNFYTIDSSIITSVGYVFETFSPYALAQFFEFNDKGWNITETCLRDMYAYLEGLRSGALWAVKLFDATTYYGGSGFTGANIRIESTDACIELMKKFKSRQRFLTLDDVIGANSSVVPFPIQVIIGHYLLEFIGKDTEKFQKIQQLICFPQSCNTLDLDQILTVQLFQPNHIIQNNSYIRHRVVNRVYKIIDDFNFFILIIFLFLSLSIYASSYLIKIYYNFKINSSKNSNPTNTKREYSDDGINRRSSLTTNIENLFQKKFQIKIIDMNWSCKQTMELENLPRVVFKPKRSPLEYFSQEISPQNILYNLFRGDDDLPQLRFQFLFTIFLIYAHLVAETMFHANNSGTKKKMNSNFIIQHSSYIFDGLFLLSGTKLAFNYLKGAPTEKFNVIENLFYMLKMLAVKILRHAPSYIFCVFAELILDRFIYNNIALEIPSFDYRHCGTKSIMSTIFYWDIFFPLTERCMPWTWFMSLEVQFFIFACLILALVVIRPQYASTIGVSFFLASIFAAILWDLSDTNQQQWVTSLTTVHQEIALFNLVSDNIFLRIPPYVIGLYLGYVLYKTSGNIQLNLAIIISGWIGCFFIGFFFQFGFDMLFSEIDGVVSTILISFGHTIWALVVMWIVLTSFSCYGTFLSDMLSFKNSNALETLSPICLIVAPIVIRFFIFTADLPIYTSNARIFPQAIGCILITYLISLLLYVLFDGLFYTIFSTITRK